jgi:hypothetical protein
MLAGERSACWVMPPGADALPQMCWLCVRLQCEMVGLTLLLLLLLLLQFQYARDTPIMPVGTTAGIVRELPWPPPGPQAPNVGGCATKHTPVCVDLQNNCQICVLGRNQHHPYVCAPT